MSKKINLRRSLVTGLLGVAVWSSLLANAQKVAFVGSERINNQAQLEQVLRTERRRLNIPQNISINAQFGESGYAKKIGEQKYEITLNTRLCPYVSVLRHELYHIADGHTDIRANRFTFPLLYFFWAEPQATLYEATGIRL